eukprot:Partr_v1_DN25724_c0_g1_i1_m74929 putative Nuclear protein localization
MIIRIRSSQHGAHRLDVEPETTMAEMISRLPREMEATALSNQPSGDRPFPVDLTVAACRLRHGDLLFAVSAPPSKGSTTNSSSPPAASADVLVSQLDAELDRDPGLIKRSRDSNFCRHGPNAMCDYCMPLEPYDQTYLKENKIKHLSFYSHLKQRHHQDKASRVLLEEPSFRVLPHCPTGHAPYPKSMCAKCQPSAIVLQQQSFRMVDHVEFESSAVVDEFIANWRRSGLQRFGYLYGRLCRHPDIPLGIKAVVESIYEPAQVSAVDGVELVSQADDHVDSLAQSLGLSRLGMIYSDLFDDGSGAGKVQTRRHKDSFFLSSAECVFIARKQLAHPFATAKAVGGQFGSRFVSVVVTGDADGNIQLFAYQVSNTCMAMVRDGIVDATVDARVMRVQESTGAHYVPDVFYKYKNEYGVQVQEAARPTFPVDYFVVSLSEGFPLEPNPRFKSV